MAQVTIYLPDDLSGQVTSAAENAGVSKSEWIARAIRSRIRTEWPESVRELAGSWSDFPDLEHLRRGSSADASRERL